jgi:diguanylate cyclase (GGDEF)-like protein/PAS domain S-box-containing protein
MPSVTGASLGVPPTTTHETITGASRLAWPARRVRWVFHGGLASIALLMLVSGLASWQGERRHSEDSELIDLAGAQRMLSQRVALLAIQPVGEAGEALNKALERSEREAARVDELLFTNDKIRFAELPTGLVIAALRWQTAREQLWQGAKNLSRAPAPGVTLPNPSLIAPFLLEADATLKVTQELVSQIQRYVDGRSATAFHRLTLLGEGGGVLLLLLAFCVAEPLIRLMRRQAERSAEQGVLIERLAAVVRQVESAVVVTDLQRRIVWANDAFTVLCGFTLQQALGRKPSDLLQTSRTDESTIARIRNAMNAREAVQAKLLNRARDGREFWIHVDIQPILNGAGIPSGFIAVERDATAEVLLSDRLRALHETMPAGMIEQDGSGAIIDANLKAQEVFGLAQEQLVGRFLVDQRWRTVHEDMSVYPGDEHAIERSLRLGASVHGDSMGVVSSQGDQRWLMVNSEPLRGAAGEITGAIACFLDVTEQRAQRTLLRLALEAGNIGTWHWLVNTSEREWSAESCSMLGFGIEEFEPLLPAWRERIHPDDQQMAHATLHSHLNNPVGHYRCDMRIRHRAGHWVWVHTCGSIVERDGAGRPRRMVGVHLDISEHKRQELQLQTNALRDALTGRPNRAAIQRQLEHCIEAHRDTGTCFAVMFVDIDRFKHVNDMLGHAGGDELLIQIGDRLEEIVRTNEPGRRMDDLSRSMVAHFGGDEFVVLLAGLTDPAVSHAMGDLLLHALARPYEVRGQAVHASASIGIVTSDLPMEGADALLDDADTAMHEAKRAGRGQWLAFEPGMRERATRRASTEADLRMALQRDELFVVYQPVLSLADPEGRCGCAGVEALVRWNHPTRGMVHPVEFIPVAEESGLIAALGRFVLETACAEFMRWRLGFGEQAPALLAVNLSVAQLRQPDLVDQVRRALASYAMPAAALQLEVTESLAAQDPLAQERLRELKAVGVKLALDDFGTGYSSLACLHQMPVDTVKIDRSFVIEAGRSEYHRALIEATIRVAHTLRMATVAEGIETIEQARLLTSLGCDKGQGYLYSRPLTAQALIAWLEQRADAVKADAAVSGMAREWV